MAKDEQGIDPKAKDGEPDDAELQREMDDLAAKREARREGRPIDGQDDDDPEPMMFPMGTLPGDPKVTWKSLVKAGTPIKLGCNLSRAEVPLTNGLYAAGSRGEVLVTFEAGKVAFVPEFGEEGSDGERKLKAARFVQELRATHTRDGAGMYNLEQILDILETHFGIPRSADKIAEVFGPVTGEQRAAAAR